MNPYEIALEVKQYHYLHCPYCDVCQACHQKWPCQAVEMARHLVPDLPHSEPEGTAKVH